MATYQHVLPGMQAEAARTFAAMAAFLVLVMVGHERPVALGLALSATANIILNLLLVPTWGMTGAAVSTTLTLICWNFLLVTVGWRRLRRPRPHPGRDST